ncbi:hypothetical protein RCL_jg5478.t1 [Rhizophagus clarus]|uniref:Uncharacterized protein n=1 Tax=Rhizophagus clarus TaxID=94130 RepID=A0A8H3M8T5_9GLOM|nr:hypothetical protein RCL_jg5478.t1 [Rhizophagus clarus]
MLVSKYAPEEFNQEDQDEEIYDSDKEFDTRNNKVLPINILLNKLQVDNAHLHDILHSFGYFYRIWQKYSD